MSWLITCSLLLVPQLAPQLAPASEAPAPQAAVRLLDVTGDGLLDELRLGHDGALSVSINVGSRAFLPVHQELPAVRVTDLLVDDLDGDGLPDLYLVSPQENVALLGDGHGRFREATLSLGLEDAGFGRSVERPDVDGDGLLDVLLHNVGGDVLFWSEAPGRYVRAASTPAGDAVAPGMDPEFLVRLLAAMIDDATNTGTTNTAAMGGVGQLTDPLSRSAPGTQSAVGVPTAPGGTLTTGPGVAGTSLGGGRHAPESPPWISAHWDAKYVNDNMNEVDSADVIDGSLTGVDVSTSSGDVTHTGGNMGVGVAPIGLAQLYVQESDINAMALRATASAVTGTGRAVVAISNAISGIAVDAWQASTTGSTIGVQSVNDSPNGIGVRSEATATTGNPVGVLGISWADSGIAVMGSNTAASGEAVGVLGASLSDDGVGVLGATTTTTPGTVTVGVKGQLTVAGGAGVLGTCPDDDGEGAGVLLLGSGVAGWSHAEGGAGVSGIADSPTGAAFGVFGQHQSTGGIGVWGDSVGGDFGTGVKGSSANGWGVHGTTEAMNSVAIVGQSLAAGGVGVIGSAFGSGFFYPNTGVTGSTYVSEGFGVLGFDLVGDGAGVLGQNLSNLYFSGSGVSGANDQPAGSGVAGIDESETGAGVYGQSGTGSPVLFVGSGVTGHTATVGAVAVGAVNTATTGFSNGLQAETHSDIGVGILGLNKGLTAISGAGVSGSSGVAGSAGVAGIDDTGSGAGVHGQSLPAAGLIPSGVGVSGRSASSGGAGVVGIHEGTSGIADGVLGQTSSPDGGTAGVVGFNSATTGFPRGIFGSSAAATGRGVFGEATHSSGANIGVTGRTFSPSGYGVFSDGDYGGTGAKYFVQPHPVDPSREIRFVCLEGNESGTYFRGSTRLVGGRAVVSVPEEFRLASDPDGLTVQLTTVGAAQVWLASLDLDQLVIEGAPDVEVHYMVNGVRLGFADYEAIRENFAYRPEVRGVPYGSQYRPEQRRLLVENGILNPDFTPNEATAQRLGWELASPSSPRPAATERELLSREDLPAPVKQEGRIVEGARRPVPTPPVGSSPQVVPLDAAAPVDTVGRETETATDR